MTDYLVEGGFAWWTGRIVGALISNKELKSLDLRCLLVQQHLQRIPRHLERATGTNLILSEMREGFASVNRRLDETNRRPDGMEQRLAAVYVEADDAFLFPVTVNCIS